MNLLEIFKPGRHVAMSGEVISFTEAELRASADAYDPKLHEAPLVVGHPKLDDPAYGWVKRLQFAETLQAEADQVEPAFADMVNAGRFKKISASFFRPEAPNNPKPGVYYLRHVGFLGAAAPAVKGLKSASFSDNEDGVIEFGDWTDVQNASMWRRMRDWLIEKFGREEADKVIPDYAVTSLTEEAARANATDHPSYSEPSPTQEPPMKALLKLLGLAETATEEQAIAALTAREASFAERERNFKAQEASFAEREKSLARAELETFIDGLIQAGKVLPAQRDAQLEFMASLSREATIEFADGDQKKKKSPLQAYKEQLAASPVAVDYGERAGATRDDRRAVDFAAPAGYAVDTKALELHNKALDYQAKNPSATYEAALTAVSR